MVLEKATAAAGVAALVVARLGAQWLRARARVHLARVHQQGATDQLRELSPGSTLTHLQLLRVEIGRQRRGR
ncbi:hypothetical protein [Streptomyces sp. NPDC057702]|uniref:hypothetical protein n=1 Tax=Streptomyces sp. NPDC057702 TaxID=3346221 RepID=UPI00369BC4CB